MNIRFLGFVSGYSMQRRTGYTSITTGYTFIRGWCWWLTWEILTSSSWYQLIMCVLLLVRSSGETYAYFIQLPHHLYAFSLSTCPFDKKRKEEPRVVVFCIARVIHCFFFFSSFLHVLLPMLHIGWFFIFGCSTHRLKIIYCLSIGKFLSAVLSRPLFLYCSIPGFMKRDM